MNIWRVYLAVLAVNTVDTINRPAYKIVLTQKGFTQFLQYDIDVPPMREYTLCLWVRIFEFTGDQTIFTYSVNGNKRIVRMWLDAERRLINIHMSGKASSSTAIDMTRDTWHHICLSYQSDFGAWALYIDGRLASCETAQSLYGYILPGGGRFIIGYGTSENGNPNGLEGEIFGVSLLLISTIERNPTIKKNPHYQQKTFIKNKLRNNSIDNFKYTVFDQQLTSQTIEPVETSKRLMKPSQNVVKFKSPHSQFEYDIGVDLNPRQTMKLTNNNDNTDLSFHMKNYGNDNIIKFRDLVQDSGYTKKIDEQVKNQFEQFGSSTKELPTVSEFETPPPLEAIQDYSPPKSKLNNNPVKFLFETDGINMIRSGQNIIRENTLKPIIPDQEVPPPVEKKEKVYGQWTTSSFAYDVLNYLKGVNGNNREENNIPATLPLPKFSDNFPYSSDLKPTKIFAPYNKNLQRRLYHKEHQISKRESRHPQINVKILENDIRIQILEEHAKTNPQNVEIKSRGRNKMAKDHRFYRNVESQSSEDMFDMNEYQRPHQFISKYNNRFKERQRHFYNSLMNILPYLKSNKYFSGDLYGDNYEIPNNKMNTKNLSNGNKWHNVKSYSNDYAPQEITLESGEINHSIDYNIAKANKKQPSIRLKYKPEYHRVVKNSEDAGMVKARSLATEITNVSSSHPNTVSILKYNHGFISKENPNSVTSPTLIGDSGKTKNNFDQHIKIGNALNERAIIGENGEESKRSFVGGNENIPDINRYRSDIDNTQEQVPPSLGPKICKNVKLFDRLFYVQPDGSIDITQILSPVKDKNIGIEFVIQNYRKCSLQESVLEQNPLLLIDWRKTPVRLFGGAYLKKTTDLCGFF